jgi:hypothetical protein
MADTIFSSPPAEPQTPMSSMERQINAFDPVNSTQAEGNQILNQVLLRSNLQGTELVGTERRPQFGNYIKTRGIFFPFSLQEHTGYSDRKDSS